MAIPTATDHKLSEIDNIAGAIGIKLMTMRHSGPAGRDIEGVRALLQDFADRVMALAHELAR